MMKLFPSTLVVYYFHTQTFNMNLVSVCDRIQWNLWGSIKFSSFLPVRLQCSWQLSQKQQVICFQSFLRHILQCLNFRLALPWQQGLPNSGCCEQMM